MSSTGKSTDSKQNISGRFNLPPVPIGIPIFGVLPRIDRNKLDVFFKKYCDENNGICSAYIGTQLYVAIGEYEVLQEALSTEALAGRVQNPLLEKVIQGCGIFFQDGEGWLNQRQTARKPLSKLDLPKINPEEIILREARELKQKLDVLCEEASGINLFDKLFDSTYSVIYSLVFTGRRENDEEAFKMYTILTTGIATKGFFTNTSIFPFILKHFSGLVAKTSSAKGVLETFRYLHKYAKEEIDKRKAVVKSVNTEPECLCDSFIIQQMKSEANGDFESFKELQLIRDCHEFFLTSVDTTSRSIEWTLLFLAMHPEIQQKVFEEISTTIGTRREPQIKDRPKFPYTNAVIEESLRLASLTTFGVLHRSKYPSTFRGYHIPADAVVIAFVYGVHQDEKYWKNPKEFDPTRFLTRNGEFQSDPRMVAFLTGGLRSCMGEKLARMDLFLVITSLIQRYSMALHPDYVDKKDQILYGGVNNGVHLPGDYKLLIDKR